MNMNVKYALIGVVCVVAIGGVLFVVLSQPSTTFTASNPSAEATAPEELSFESSSETEERVAIEEVSKVVANETKHDTARTDITQAKPSSVAVEKTDTPASDQGFDQEKIRNNLVDFGFFVPSKPRSIDTIILHSSYDSIGDDPYSIDGIIDIYKSYDVSAHYLIGRNGTVYRLVKDEYIAYHAGVSKMPDGRTNANDFSIGIEMVNTKTGNYTDAQYASVKKLIAYLKGKYAIRYVLGHDDIAPDRKTDPWNFDWKKLKGDD